MWYIKIKRFFWAIKFGWLHTGQICNEYFGGRRHLAVFVDFFVCFLKCGIKSSQYKQQMLWKLDKTQRKVILDQSKEVNQKKNAWEKEFFINRNFLIKYMSFRYEKSWLKEKRNRAYAKRYNAGKNLYVEHDVNISRQHYLEGSISIGDNVLLAKHVFIDYSGDVTIQDDVALANGVIIESHTHILEKKGAPAAPGRLVIEKGVKVLSRAYIGDTCHFIGRYARIGAGAYIRGNVLPYAIMIGNPAKIVGFMYSPDEVEKFEKNVFPEGERIDVEKYRQDYKKFYIDRRKEIKNFLQK